MALGEQEKHQLQKYWHVQLIVQIQKMQFHAKGVMIVYIQVILAAQILLKLMLHLIMVLMK